MKITLSQHAGFCDGVERAYEMVMDIDMALVRKPVFVLGSIAHNPEVAKKIEEKGIKTIKKEDFFKAKPGQLGTVVIAAHGVGPEIYGMAEEKNIDIIDTTCPRVIRVQRLAKFHAEKGRQVIIVGDRNHTEVVGINSWGKNNAIIVSDSDEWEKIKIPGDKKIIVLAQTTQNEDFYKKTGEYIKNNFKNVEVFLTTCQPTHARQSEIKEIAEKNEVVIIIGSKTSANSKRLWEISSLINPKSYFIENKDDVKKEWFYGVATVGISAGASTPPWTVEEIVDYLRNI